ncbi:hypothetical protein FSP39_010612 [Pinctada imbricata]|uniref:Uncharacterized protein n=1 Tax=Pinctada imbricata TaxID=66713 RepID=A0AA88XV42_PINIB|nr:hypothetical protein FSP39_010612 [Pinctada imbricata]
MTTKGKGFMAKGPNTIDQNFAEKLFKYGRERVPEYSRLHPVVPQLYVQEWKTDMKNRKLIMQNAEIGGVPKYEHDENLFLDKREQMHL